MQTTKGKVQVTNRVIGLKNISVGSYTVAITFDTENKETDEGNAELIADAFELQNRCPKKPSEVFEALCSVTKEKNRLRYALKDLLIYCSQNCTSQLEPLLKRAEEALQNK